MTDNQKARLERCNEVTKLVKTGKTVQEACKQVGISAPTYYLGRKQRKPKKAHKRNKVKAIDLPEQVIQASSGQLMLLIGSSSRILEVMRQFS